MLPQNNKPPGVTSEFRSNLKIVKIGGSGGIETETNKINTLSTQEKQPHN